MKKITISLLVAISLCIAIVGVSVFAAAPTVSAEYNAETKKVTITGTASSDVIIYIYLTSQQNGSPKYMDGVTVTNGSFTYTLNVASYAEDDYTVKVQDSNNEIGEATFSTKPVPTEEPTEAPTTAAPSTEAPTTEAPSTEAPTTEAPSTEAPTTEAPSTEAPTTAAPSTEAPTTAAPSTEAPTTAAPATEEPTTEEPTTEAPTTEAPTETADPNPQTGSSANMASIVLALIAMALTSGLVIYKRVYSK